MHQLGGRLLLTAQKMGLRRTYRRVRIMQIADLIFSETANAGSFKMRQDINVDSLYISTGNDAASYFRSEAYRINVFNLSQVRVAISR